MIEPPAIVTKVEWDRCLGWLEAALEYAEGTHNANDVLDLIQNNNATFWPLEKSVIVTEFVQWPRFKQLHYWLVGGDLQELLSVEPGITEWGRSQGCTRFSAAGRMGWARVMKPLGYQPLCITVFKDIAP